MKRIIKLAFIVVCMALVGTSEYIFPAEGLGVLNAEIESTQNTISKLSEAIRGIPGSTISKPQLQEYLDIKSTITQQKVKLAELLSLKYRDPEFVAQIHSGYNKLMVIGGGLMITSACVGLGVSKMYNLTFDDREKEKLHPTAHMVVNVAIIASITGGLALFGGFLMKAPMQS